jgi:hypothetical protein
MGKQSIQWGMETSRKDEDENNREKRGVMRWIYIILGFIWDY